MEKYFLSRFFKCIQNEDNRPADSFIQGIDMQMPYVFLGDDAYTLQKHLMKPYSKRNVNEQERIFNGRLSRTRRCIKCCFGIMANKWRVLHKSIETNVDHADNIIKCICVLHNVVIDKDGHNIQLLNAVRETVEVVTFVV